MHKRRKAAVAALLCIAISLFLNGCSNPGKTVSKNEDSESVSSGAVSEPEAGRGDWAPSEPAISVFDEEGAITDEGGTVSLDVSSASKGYAAVKAENQNRLKFQVVFGDRKYNYDLSGDGTALIVPLQSGDGTYTFRVLENTSDNKYAEVFSYEEKVQLEDEFQPFLHSSSMVAYTRSGDSTQKAWDLVQGISNDADFVASVYDYLKNRIAYDYEFAESSPEMYYPDPDATLKSGKGICFDYAATAAAMIRSVGIPAKLITGYVTPGDIYHAWNMIYLKDKGWITMEISVKNNTWQLIDITFAATGESRTTGNGLEYKDKDVY